MNQFFYFLLDIGAEHVIVFDCKHVMEVLLMGCTHVTFLQS